RAVEVAEVLDVGPVLAAGLGGRGQDGTFAHEDELSSWPRRRRVCGVARDGQLREQTRGAERGARARGHPVDGRIDPRAPDDGTGQVVEPPGAVRVLRVRGD